MMDFQTLSEIVRRTGSARKQRHFSKTLSTFLGVVLVFPLLVGCPANDSWRKQSVALTATGYTFNGAAPPKRLKWTGTGLWVSSDTLVTNAHVALHGLKIEGKDDKGNEFLFKKIVAYDPTRDIAILKVWNKTDAKPITLVTKPTDPKTLRGTEIISVGNTGGLTSGQGLSFYKGNVTNVTSSKLGHDIVHDSQISYGSSGGPLIDKATGQLLGVNKGVSHAFRQSVATAAWDVQEILNAASKRRGTDLEEAFNPKNLPFEPFVTRNVCLKPGQFFQLPFPVQFGATDFFVAINHGLPGKPLQIGMLYGRGKGKKLYARGSIKKSMVAAWTVGNKTRPGLHTVVLVNSKKSQHRICAKIAVGLVDWNKRIK
jgi:hypothetical protein